MAAAVVARTIMLTEQKLRAIGDYVYEKWVNEVQTSNRIPQPNHTWRDTNYRQDYLRGLKRPAVFGDTLSLQLTDPAALKVELGWAPPRGADELDGLGEYDGKLHDLRPWLFKFGKIRKVKHGKRRGKLYRNLRFITPGMEAQIQAMVDRDMADVLRQSTALGLEVSEEEQANMVKRMKKSYRAAYHGAIAQAKGSGRYSMWGAKLGARSKAEFYHVTSLYDRARPFRSAEGPGGAWFKHLEKKRVKLHMMNKSTNFKTFRIIFKDRNANTNPDSYFTKGIAPANLISGRRAPVAMALRQAVKNVIAGKNPDGSNGN